MSGHLSRFALARRAVHRAFHGAAHDIKGRVGNARPLEKRKRALLNQHFNPVLGWAAVLSGGG